MRAQHRPGWTSLAAMLLLMVVEPAYAHAQSADGARVALGPISSDQRGVFGTRGRRLPPRDTSEGLSIERRNEGGTVLLFTRQNVAPSLAPTDSTPSRGPLRLDRHVLGGALLGAVVGTGGMALALTSGACDDCFFEGFYLVGAGVGGIVLGGLLGAYVYELRSERRRNGEQHAPAR